VKGFAYSLTHERLHTAVGLWDNFSSTFLSYADGLEEIMEAILISFSKSPFFIELKFFILD
jgi:hypothetical protein